MKGPANTMIGSMAAFLLAIWVVACTSVQEQPKPAAPFFPSPRKGEGTRCRAAGSGGTESPSAWPSPTR